jgi:hypothetical protein
MSRMLRNGNPELTGCFYRVASYEHWERGSSIGLLFSVDIFHRIQTAAKGKEIQRLSLHLGRTLHIRFGTAPKY